MVASSAGFESMMERAVNGAGHVTASWAAIGKWAVRDSGDAVSVVQLGSGRLVGLIVDVQGTGSGASTTAWSLATLGAHLAGEGADAITLASMLNRALWTRRGGRVQADLGVVIVDPGLHLTFATYGSVWVASIPGFRETRGDGPPPAGLYGEAQPDCGVTERGSGSLAMCSDGVAATLAELLALMRDDEEPLTATAILARALARDQGRPRNDMSVIVMSTSGSDQAGPSISGELRVGHRSTVSRGGTGHAADSAG